MFVSRQGALKPRTARSRLDEWGQTDEGHRDGQCWLSHLHLGSFRGWGCVIWGMLILCFLLSIPFIRWSFCLQNHLQGTWRHPSPDPPPRHFCKKAMLLSWITLKNRGQLMQNHPCIQHGFLMKSSQRLFLIPSEESPSVRAFAGCTQRQAERVRWPHGSLGGLPAELAFVGRAASQGRYHSGWRVPHFPSWSKGRLKKNLNLIHSKAANDCFRPWDQRLHFHYLSQCL